jgi:hypothetical protein
MFGDFIHLQNIVQQGACQLLGRMGRDQLVEVRLGLQHEPA